MDAPANSYDHSTMNCLRCQHPLRSAGQHAFVTGGSSAGAKFFFGQLAEMGEKNVALEVYACDHCNHIEFFNPFS